MSLKSSQSFDLFYAGKSIICIAVFSTNHVLNHYLDVFMVAHELSSLLYIHAQHFIRAC